MWSYRTEGGDERKMRKKAKRKAIEVMFTLSFILTGCGIDSIFVSKRGALTWAVAAIVLVFCAAALGGRYDNK